VTQVAVTKTFADVVCPLLKFGGVDFNGRAAHATREVMVVRLNDATSIETFAAVGHHDVDFAVLDQLLQLRIDGRQGYSSAFTFDERVELLGAHEALQMTQDADNLSSLHRISGRGHEFIVVVAGLLSRTILINVVGIILERKGQCRACAAPVHGVDVAIAVGRRASLCSRRPSC
jgi:hypothetical protein